MRETLQSAAARRVARPAPLRQAVYDALAELIANGSLKPGQHLVEQELAEHLGVSRQPVREALQRLQGDGWVELRPALGAFVHTPTEEEVAQLLGVRAALEAYAAHDAAQHASQEQVDKLWELHKSGIAALESDDDRALAEANTTLHQHITQMSGNKVLIELMGQVERRVRWYYGPIARPRGKEAWNEHATLIRAIANGNADRAEELMRRHTRRTTDFYRKQTSSSSKNGKP
jgi:DNA-binding GntR family transcriptional regulator